MNERIKQLMGQALDEKFAGTWSVMDLQDLTKFADRFSELIVRECMAKVCEELDNSYSEDGKEILNERVLEHFGVEE
jgi:hypothetical protein